MAANQTIEAVLSPLTVSSFLDDYWGRQFVHIRGSADPDRFSSLFDWDAINQQVENQTVGTRRMRLVSPLHGEVSEANFTRETTGLSGEARRCIDPRAVSALLAGGASLILNGVNERHRPIQRLAEEFERQFGDRTNVNAYIGFAGARGFDAHWDDHEVFALQVQGQRQWRVWARSTEAPLFRDLLPDEAPPQDLLWEGMLNAGDVLYLPRGFWHEAQEAQGPTVHLSFGVDCSTGIDLLRWLTRELRASAAFRRDLPRFGSVDDRRAFSRELREEVARRWTDDLVGEYLAAHDGAAVSYAGAGLPASVTMDPDHTLLRWLPPRDVELQVEAVLGRFMEFSCHGRDWHLPRRSEAFLRLLVARREIRLRDAHAELAGKLEPYEVAHYIHRWMADGLLEARTEEAEVRVR